MAHAVFVDVPHVKHLQMQARNGRLLGSIHAANPHEGDIGWQQRRRPPAPTDEWRRAVSEQASHWHAVQIAAGAAGLVVDVGVGVEPEHAKMPMLAIAMPRNSTDRTDGQAVIAPHQQREIPLGQRVIDCM